MCDVSVVLIRNFLVKLRVRITAGAHGVRRILAPMLDLANHHPVPSAMYAFASGSTCGLL